MRKEPSMSIAPTPGPFSAADLIAATLPASRAQTLHNSLLSAAAVMARLRDADNGCAWDLAQNFRSIVPYTIEEAYEVADAVERGAMDDLCEELGDLLFQVLFHARMAEEAGAFDLAAVADGLVRKMVRRHPHVFGGATQRTAGEQLQAWETLKAQERADRMPDDSVLSGVAKALPALSRAEKLSKRAARIGFDWPTAQAVLDKLEEEVAELRAAHAEGDLAKVHEEMGDVLFVVANLARKMQVEPEHALRDANGKFERRFRHVEQRARAMPGGSAPLDVLEEFWLEAKAMERSG
jgi:MazG family protein